MGEIADGREMERTVCAALQKVSDNLHSYIDHLNADSKVEEPLYEKRLASCKRCDLLMDGMCRACGCYVELRAAMRKNACPYEKWKAEL